MVLLSAQDAYRLWAPTYDDEPNPLVALERRVMTDLLAAIDYSRVLDVACGTGYWMRRLASDAVLTFGCDLCQEMLATGSPLPRAVVADAEHLPFSTAIADLALCSLSLGYLPHLDIVFREFARVVSTNGYLAISDVHPQALQSGWKRAFKIDLIHYEIRHALRPLGAIAKLAAKHGFRLLACQDAHFGPPEFPLFARAGKAASFEAVHATPALFAALWQKSC